MSPADRQEIDEAAEDAVSDLSRAEVFKAGREFLAIRSPLHNNFGHWLWEREVSRLTEAYYDNVIAQGEYA